MIYLVVQTILYASSVTTVAIIAQLMVYNHALVAINQQIIIELY